MTEPTQNDRLAALAARRAERADSTVELPAAGPTGPVQQTTPTRRVRLPSTTRLATAGASAVSFAAMVVAMGPLTATTDAGAAPAESGETEAPQLSNPAAPGVNFDVGTSSVDPGIAPGDPLATAPVAPADSTAAADPSATSTAAGAAPAPVPTAAPAGTTPTIKPATGATAAPGTAAPPATAPPAVPPTAAPTTAPPVTAPPATAAPTTAPPTTAASG